MLNYWNEVVLIYMTLVCVSNSHFMITIIFMCFVVLYICVRPVVSLYFTLLYHRYYVLCNIFTNSSIVSAAELMGFGGTIISTVTLHLHFTV